MPQKQQNQNMTNGKIVVADDDPDITRLLSKLLAQEGYTVTAVNDGVSALKTYEAEKPDLMILDINMPGKDGLTLCQEIRDRDDRVLILMLTGQKAQIKKISGLGGGADDYITKPFGHRELMARIRSLFRRLDV